MGATLKRIAAIAGYVSERAAIEFACKLSPDDRVTLELARWWQLKDKPMASKFLDNYLAGGGDIEVDTAQLLKDDSKVRQRLFENVAAGLKAGKTTGVLPVPQRDFQNQEWRNATGSINLNWKLNGNNVEVSFVNWYRWHPKDARVTQCIHQAAENLKTQGAKEFRMIGKSAQVPVSEILPPTPATKLAPQGRAAANTKNIYG